MVANDNAFYGNEYVEDHEITNAPHVVNGLDDANSVYSYSLTENTKPRQDPIAVVGVACRLPGHSTSPKALWDFIERGGIAKNEPPSSRYNIKGHYDGSQKPLTMRTPGGMFLEDIDLQAFDAQFFNTNRTDAIAMDPQQRQLLEVVYECLENAGVTLEQASGAQIGCFVGSYAVDFADMAGRDPEDRAESITIGIGRAILSNRISHFLNLKGPSMTIDTACSGSLVSVDVACQYLQARQASGVLVAGANLYMSPDHNMDMGAMRGASSATGKCHTFDAKADGYCKGEAVNAVYLKRLEDAIRDGDPIRAVIRGTATNSDGWTPGIASPSSQAQEAAIRAAYANAGITNFNETGYLECHGTGTLAGDPIEVQGAANVFAPTRPADRPLIIGSIKSNIGHSEPAAGISGLLKAVLAVEKGIIPGNPTFIDPNPKINFEKLRVRATRSTISWPFQSMHLRRASVNSFGYGGSNAHVVIEAAEHFLKRPVTSYTSSYAQGADDFLDLDDDETTTARPKLLVFSANDKDSLKSYVKSLSSHLINPSVNIKLDDLTYTLSERRSRHFQRAFALTNTTTIPQDGLTFGKKHTDAPKVGFVFTGQGAQWSQMGKDLVQMFPDTKALLQRLDVVLQGLPNPPSWSLLSELTEARSPEHLRLPEFSQPLVTALQLCILLVLRSWGIKAERVIGHSSGEIAAACAAGLLTPEEAIKIAYYRGAAAKDRPSDVPVGMLAVGIGFADIPKYLKPVECRVQIACFNSPNSLTLSGSVEALEEVKENLQADGHFARMLQVNLAYHSAYMNAIGEYYEELLHANCSAPLQGDSTVKMFSSVTGQQMNGPANASYWKSNMVSPVQFSQACTELLSGKDGADFLIEIGPSNALAGPVAQIKKSLSGEGSHITYTSAAKRGPTTISSLYGVAGQLFLIGGEVSLPEVNKDDEAESKPKFIVDLPNYAWNHSTKYWHESEASKDWRFRKYVHHDLLGSKILGTSWKSPSWKKTLRLADVPWLKDHKMGHEIIFPGAGYIGMAMEAVRQTMFATAFAEPNQQPEKWRYSLRDLKFPRALVLEENSEARIMLALTPVPSSTNTWYEYKVSSFNGETWSEHSTGFVRIETDFQESAATEEELKPLKYATPGRLWYKAMHDAGYNFGPDFQKHMDVESTTGSRYSRSLVSLEAPPSRWKQSDYPMHPACIDGCFQSVAPSLWLGDRSSINAVLVPAVVDSLIIQPRSQQPSQGVSITSSEYIGVGRKEDMKNYLSNGTVYDQHGGSMLFQLKGLRYHKLETRADVYTSHIYTRMDWKPDVSFLNEVKLQSVLAKVDASSSVQEVIDMIAHKTPNLKVVELNLTPEDSSSLWLEKAPALNATRAALKEYQLVSNDAAALVKAQDRYSGSGNTVYSLLDPTKDEFTPPANDFDLAIVKTAALSVQTPESLLQNVRKFLSAQGYALFVEVDDKQVNGATVNGVYTNGHSSSMSISDVLSKQDFTNIQAFDVDNEAKLPSTAFLAVAADIFGQDEDDNKNEISLVHLSKPTSVVSNAVKSLQNLGWKISEHSYPFETLHPKSTILVLDELSTPVLATADSAQWDAIQHLIQAESNILWVTAGSQMEVTDPVKAVAHGFFRTLRGEEPMLNLVTLDVETGEGAATIEAIDSILNIVCKPMPMKQVESEFVERRGVMHVSRVLPDERLNVAKFEDSQGTELQEVDLHENKNCVRLICENLGNFDSLHYNEVSAQPLPLKENNVEVELYASALNFKDVAVSMGIVPENEHLLGLEGAGIITRVADDVTNRRVGQRVVVFEKGTFANRIHATTERTFPLPDSMTFEEASTLPAVYLTSMYALFYLANLQRGQRVLIHSAAGGVGIASIQLCQYMGCEIFVTVGAEEKRRFLIDSFGIPEDRIFSSRAAEFAKQIMKITNNAGIDVILNSLVGDLLDESWRIIADGGTMVEIGKKDIIDRNSLSMEPFGRNASFRALDFSYRQISDTLIAKILSELFQLIEQDHVKPIAPREIFSYEDVPAAFRVLRSGKHMGKLVISNGLQPQVRVPIRPAKRQLRLRPDLCYLIVGGLKGLCGSLAIYLAKKGAKHLAVISRSGHGDETSQGVVKNIRALGCHIDLLKGDVANLQDVQRCFKETTVPIGGIIQGAMVLRDRTFGSMTIEDYHGALACKVQGTWNLHTTAMEQNLSLDFFTMLSSISGVVGQKGQANYAGGNVFLDSLAVYRQSLGLAACSVDLGVIEDVGYIHAHDGLQQNLDTSIWTGINEGLLRKILELSIFQQTATINPASSTQLITGIPVPQPDDSQLLADARFAGLFVKDSSRAAGGEGGDGSKDIQAFFLLLRSKVDAAAVLAAAVEVVNKQFTKMLRLGEPMDAARPISIYGLDSLAAVEVRNWLRKALGAELTTLEIVNATSLVSLSEKIISRITPA